MNGLIGILILILVVGVIVWLVNYLVDTLPVADPFGRIAKVVVMVGGVVVVIVALLGLVGYGPGLAIR